MKGISAIIATILLLLITIAMAGTAYMYISGMLTGKTEKIVSILSATCSQNGETLTIVISNDGASDAINAGTDLNWIVDEGGDIDPDAGFICTPDTINPHESAICTKKKDTDKYSGTITVTVVSPGISLSETIYC